jgi:hypothetical protein
MNPEMKTMFLVAPRSNLLNRKMPSIIKVQCFEYDEKLWAVPEFGRVFFEGYEIFRTYEEAKVYQNSVIDAMILSLRARQEELNNTEGEIVNA